MNRTEQFWDQYDKLHQMINEAKAAFGQLLENCLGQDTPSSIKVGMFLHLVEDNFKKEHLPLFYANSLNMSKSNLRKLCAHTINCSPVDLIQKRIIIEAFKLLDDRGNSVKEVAHSLGFEDPAYFSRFFRRNFGFSPVMYQKHRLLK